MNENRNKLLDQDLPQWADDLQGIDASVNPVDGAADSSSFFEKINRLSLELDKRLLKLEAKNQD